MKGEEPTGTPLSDAAPVDIKDHPIIGYLAVGCGLMGIFSWGLIFVPMGLAFSVAALIAGQGGWGFGGLFLAAVGMMTSPTLLTVLGVSTFLAFFGIPGF